MTRRPSHSPAPSRPLRPLPPSHPPPQVQLQQPSSMSMSMCTKIVFRLLVLLAILGLGSLLSSLVLGPSSTLASLSLSPFTSSADPPEPHDPHQQHNRTLALAATSAAPTRILAWTKVNGQPGFESFHINFCGATQPTCIVTHHRSLLNDSAALLFSSTDLSASDLPSTYPRTYGARDPLQPWVLYSEVSPVEHPPPYPLLDPSWTRLFDYSMSYRLDSDFPIPAISGTDLVAALSAPLDTPLVESRFTSSQRSPILWLASPGSCTSDNHRHALVAALEAAGLPVDSLNGACTTTLGRPMPAPDGNLVALLQQYKFVLVLETSNCNDYVSRSLVSALQAQTLPIVDGPPLESYVQVVGRERLDTVLLADAGGNSTAVDDAIASLVSSVKRLANSQQAYVDRMQSARAQRLDPAWHARWTSPTLARGRRSGWCGLCSMAAQADTLRVAERAYQSQLVAGRRAVEQRLAQDMADVDVMRSELVGVIKQHATSVKQRKLLTTKFGARMDAWNATTWLNASTYLPLPAHPLANRKHLPPKRALLAPDYSCALGKWSTDALEPAAQTKARYLAQSLPADYLSHALPESAPEVMWPRPVGRRKRGKSRYADLTGELLVRGAGDKLGGVGSGAQVMDPSEASGKQEDEEAERMPRLELEYPPMDADSDSDGDTDGDEAKRAPWDVFDGILVGLFVTGVAGMYASALGLNTAATVAGAGVDALGKRKRVTSLTSAMAAGGGGGGKHMSPPQGVRLLPLRRQSVTHGVGGHHLGFVTSPVQEEGEEAGGSGLKML